MPGNYTSREVVTVALAWGCRLQDRRGGHTAIWAPGAREPVIVRDVGRPDRGFTSPAVLKRLALFLGLADEDEFMAGPKRHRRQSLDSSSGNLPALAHIESIPPLPGWQPPEWSGGDADPPLPQNARDSANLAPTIGDDPMTLRMEGPDAIPRVNTRGGLGLADVLLQVLVAQTTADLAHAEPGAGRPKYSSNDLRQAMVDHHLFAHVRWSPDDLPGVINKRILQTFARIAEAVPQVTHYPGVQVTLGNKRDNAPAAIQWNGPCGLRWDEVQFVEANLGSRAGGRTRARVDEPLDGSTQVIGEVEEPPPPPMPEMPRGLQPEWEQVGRMNDGTTILRDANGVLFRAVRL